MRSRTFYFSATTNARFERIRAHLGEPTMSRALASALSAAEDEYTEHPTSRPWDEELPSLLPASRHTTYLHSLADQRLERLRAQFQATDGCLITSSVVVARAIALAEKRVMTLTPSDIELRRIRSDANAIEVEVHHLSDECGEDAIASLVACMHQVADLFARAQRVRATAGAVSPSWREASELLIGPLNDLVRKVADAITTLRRETDQRTKLSR